MKVLKNISLLVLCSLILGLQSCREDLYIFEEEVVDIDDGKPLNPDGEIEIVDGGVQGFYLLNEGNMGMNRASIDFFNFETAKYHRDIFSARNPEVVKELGDVGNDIQIYGSKLYAVINVSNYIEVMDAKTAKHITRISVPNCRYITFHEGKAYISSYSGRVAIDPNAEIGFVAEIDTTSLELTRKVEVGYQPEQMVIQNNKLYVANSGGYRVPNYDRTVSVVDLDTFKEVKKIDVAINLHRMLADRNGDIYVSSRGDYYDVPPSLYIIDGKTEKVKKHLDIPIGGMTLSGDSIYFYSVAFSYYTGQNEVSYGIINTNSQSLVADQIITDARVNDIIIPYGIAIQPETKDIYITDAQNYVVTGYLYCFDSKGKFKWRVQAGNIPAHFTFLYK